MAFTKITDSDLANKGVVGLPDTPNLSTGEMQRKFDEIATDVIVPKFNELAEELDDIGLDKVTTSDDVTDFKLDDEGRLMISTNHGETFGYAGSTGHQIIDGSGTKYPARANLQFSQNVTIRDYDESNGNKTFLSISGEKGEPGKAATITIGNVESGDEAKVENVGSNTNAIFNMTFPKGNKGDAATIQVGTIRSGDTPSVTNRGTSSEAIFDFTLPKGEKGETGQGINILGEYDTLSDLQSAHPTGNPGNAYMVGTTNPKDLYVWDVDNSRWANQGALQGVKGDKGDAGSITIGVVTEGETMKVENVGTSEDAIFNFTLKKGGKGDKGDSGTIAVGVVTSGDEASVTNVGTPESAIFDFVIPRGEKGERGNPTTINGKEGVNITLFGTDIMVDEDSSTTIKEYIENNGGGSLVRVYSAQENFGETITFEIGGITQSATIPIATPNMVSFSTPELGEATITNTTSGIAKSINIDTYSLYNVDMTATGFNYNEWLSLGGITKSFSSLDEVLADEPTIRILMTKHASIDYLASFEDENADITTIVNNDICAKWINLRDYALDTLYANPVLKTEMDTADKYFYGEWVEIDGVWQPKGNVPIMTGNTSPYGEASASSSFSNSYAYFALNQDDTKQWSASQNSTTNQWLQYTFVNPCKVKKFIIKNGVGDSNFKTYKLQAYDGTTWIDLTDNLINPNDARLEAREHIINNDNYYMSYRVFVLNGFSTTYLNIGNVQFYGRELKVSVPAMTSNTTPWGEAFASSDNNNAYKSFIPDTSSGNWWNGNANGWLAYDFENPIVVKVFVVNSYNTTKFEQFIIQATNNRDGDWIDIYSGTKSNSGLTLFVLDNSTAYRYWRVKDNGNKSDFWMYFANFYGLDYSEHEERHYIYDNGVEVEEVTKTATSVLATIDTTNYTLLRATTGNDATTSDTIKCGSASANLNDIPNNSYLDITNVNGENETGFSSVANTSDISCWVE